MFICGSQAVWPDYEQLGLLYSPVFDSVNVGHADTDLKELFQVFGEGVSPSREIGVIR